MAAFASMTLLCGIYCALAALKTWPILDGDAPAYFRAAVEWGEGRSLTNPLWLPPLDDSLDGPGGRRFTYHGFLYPLIVGSLARLAGGGPEASVAAAYLLHWLAAVVAGVCVLSAAASLRGPVRTVLAGVTPLAMLGLSIAWHGRVEPLALLLIACGAWAWRALPPVRRETVSAAIATLLLFTSPAAGLMAGCLLLAAVVASEAARTDARRLSAAMLGSLAAAAVAVAIYPYPILDWVEGVRRHGRINLGLPVGQGFAATWLIAPELPLLAVTFGAVLVGASRQSVRVFAGLRAWRRIVFAASLAFFYAGLARTAFLKTEAAYNAAIWIPLLACLSLASASRLAPWVVAAAFALPAAGLARSSAILATQFEPDAVAFADVRNRLRALAPSGCSATPGLWLAASGLGMEIAGVDRGAPCLILQQAKTGRAEPPTLPGYRLIENAFRPGVMTMGVPISRTRGGWEYAVYWQDAEGVNESDARRVPQPLVLP
jgi:hypothetical protein